MCGRFKLKASWSDLWQMYNLIKPEDKARNTAPRYNIAPTQNVPFIYVDKDGNQVVDDGRIGSQGAFSARRSQNRQTGFDPPVWRFPQLQQNRKLLSLDGSSERL